MGLETGVVYIDDLVTTNPNNDPDTLAEADDHLRAIKTAVKGSFPNLGQAAVTGTAAELNTIDGFTGSTANLNTAAGSDTALIDAVYPVGSIYISTVATNPGTLLGVGTWAATGVGRMLIGVGTSDTAYALDDTGGASDVSKVLAHTHTFTTDSDGAHDHNVIGGNGSAGATVNTEASGTGTTVTNAAPTTGSAHTHDGTTDSTGAAGAGDNMPPYLCVHMWERTA